MSTAKKRTSRILYSMAYPKDLSSFTATLGSLPSMTTQKRGFSLPLSRTYRRKHQLIWWYCEKKTLKACEEMGKESAREATVYTIMMLTMILEILTLSSSSSGRF
uniref:Uncharacterized protein n=1 Tax=Opuntia streptacantha TaxID=393608 RepID=A0A7C8ZCM6_OPUST